MVIAAIFKNSIGGRVKERRGTGDSCERTISQELEASVDAVIWIL